MSPHARPLELRVSQVRAHLRALLLRAWLLSVAGGVGVALLAAWALAGPTGWRPGSDVPLLVDVAVLVWVGATAAVLARVLRAWCREDAVAAGMERAAGLNAGTLRGALEVARRLPGGVSPALAERAAALAVAGVDGRDVDALSGASGARARSVLRRGAGALGAVALLVAAAGAADPARARAAWGGLAHPFATARTPLLPPLQVEPGDLEVPRGSDVELRIEAPGRDEVALVVQAEGDVPRRRVVALEADGTGAATLRAVSSRTSYRVSAPDGAAAGPFVLRPVDPLFVGDVTVRAHYPPHTGRSQEEFRGRLPALTVPAGTLLEVEGAANRPLTHAALVDSAGRRVASFETRQTAFQGAWRPSGTGVYTWRFTDDRGEEAVLGPDPLEVRLIADAPPEISITLPGRDTVIPMGRRQPLVVEAMDDYGLTRLELVAYRVRVTGERDEPEVQGVDLSGTRTALARPLLDLRAWGLVPGDTVRYYARVLDNGPEPQEARTPEYVLRMPSVADVRDAAGSELEEMAERVEGLARAAAEGAEKNRRRAAEAGSRDGTRTPAQQGAREPEAFGRLEELEQALREQEALADGVDSLRARLEALEEMMEDAGAADPELAEDLQALQELLGEMEDAEMARRSEGLREALERQEAVRAAEELSDVARQQDDMRERLERALERFRRAAVEQDFRAATHQAEELAREQRAITESLEEGDRPELRARQQDAVEAQAETLQERMARLEERLDELEETRARDGVRDASQRLEEARRQMREAASEAGAQPRDGAEKARRSPPEAEAAAREGEARAPRPEERAAEELERAAQELRDAQNQMSAQRAARAEAALRRASDDALELARRQAALQTRMEAASAEELAALRADEASLLQGVRKMAEGLHAETDGEAPGQRELSAQMGRTMESIQRTLQAMERSRGRAPAQLAEVAVGDLNQLALMAMAGAEMMNRQGGQGQEGQEVQEQLETLAQQQGDLMNQAAQLMPLQLGQQAMAEQAQEMSLGQESVADRLGDLADEPSSQEALGDVRAMADEAAALARELGQGRLTPDVLRRQERLFHRLLDAGRSLEREEFSDQRESEAPGAFERGVVRGLSAEELGALRFGLPDAATLARMTPAMRQLVLRYYERLNRRGGGS